IVYPFGRWNAILATVSVVLIASAAARPPDREASATAASAPASKRSMGRRSPIRPVEQTAISPAESASRSARRSALEWGSAKPSAPVQAFAPPELSRPARTLPPRTTCWVHSTGAAFTRLTMNTPAAARDGPSLITTTTSRPPDALIPAATPAARNPSGAVTLMGWPPGQPLSRREALCGEAGGFGRAGHEVGGRDRLARRALAEVVQGGDDHRAPGVAVGGGLQVDRVRAERGRGGRPAVFGEQVHERLAGVGGR